MADVTVQMQGNLVADPDLRHTQSGHSVAQFSLASTPRKYNSSTKEWEDGETVYLRVQVWRELADGATDSLRKGDLVSVTGKLRQRSYEKDGQKRTVFEIEADTVGKSVRAKKARQAAAADEGPGW